MRLGETQNVPLLRHLFAASGVDEGQEMMVELCWWLDEWRRNSEHTQGYRSEQGGGRSWRHLLSSLVRARGSVETPREDRAMPWTSCSPCQPDERA